MATIGNDPNGRKRILFVAGDGSRKTIRLGKIDRKNAERFCRTGGEDHRRDHHRRSAGR